MLTIFKSHDDKIVKKSFKATIEHKGTKASIEADNTSINDVALASIIMIGIIIVVYLFKRNKSKAK